MKIPPPLSTWLYVLMWPGLFVYLRFSSRTRVFMVHDGSVLLIRGVLGNESWGLPGGGLHRHEEPMHGAVREASEEVGVALVPAQLESMGVERVSMQGLAYQCHFFGVNLQAKPNLHLQKLEIAEAGWFPIESLPKLRVRTEVKRAAELWVVR